MTPAAPPPLWRSPQPARNAARDLLPTIDDDLLAELVEQLAMTIVALEERLRTTRDVQSAALTLCHNLKVENRRLEERLVRLIDRQRQRGST